VLISVSSYQITGFILSDRLTDCMA